MRERRTDRLSLWRISPLLLRNCWSSSFARHAERVWCPRILSRCDAQAVRGCIRSWMGFPFCWWSARRPQDDKARLFTVQAGGRTDSRAGMRWLLPQGLPAREWQASLSMKGRATGALFPGHRRRCFGYRSLFPVYGEACFGRIRSGAIVVPISVDGVTKG